MIKRNGYMRLYRGVESLAGSALERAVLAEHGVRVEHLDEHAIHDLEPHLAHRFKAALLFPDSGSVESPGELVAAYRAAMLAQGGVLLKGFAETLFETAEAAIVRTASDSVSAATAVLSAGAWGLSRARRAGSILAFAGPAR